MSNNPPEVLVGLSLEQAEFIIKNCDANVQFALSRLMDVEEDTARKMVEQMEQFKALKSLVEKAIKER